jgi:1-pyrroline-5-carboxylate dehydrogenase
MSFRLTYATMFNPPRKCNAVRGGAGRARSAFGARHRCVRTARIDSPRTGAPSQPDRHRRGARRIPARRLPRTSTPRCAPRTPRIPHGARCRSAERAALLRKAGDLMQQRVYDIAAALTLEVGKNRMEALGEAQETVDFFHHYADDFEQHAGFDNRCRTIRIEAWSRATAA